VIVPRPTRLIRRHGRFALDRDTAIRATPGARGAARLLRALVRPATGLPLPLQEDGRVVFALDDRLVGLGDEGYALTVNEHAVVLRAATRQGLAHGVQTIRQLLPAAALGSRPVSGVDWALPGVDIRDAPRLPRGEDAQDPPPVVPAPGAPNASAGAPWSGGRSRLEGAAGNQP